MFKSTILTALAGLSLAITISVPAQADDQSTISNSQNSPILIAQVYHDYAKEAAAEAEWERRNGSFPYTDNLGRAYGPSGYAPNTGAGAYGGVYSRPYSHGVPNAYGRKKGFQQNRQHRHGR